MPQTPSNLVDQEPEAWLPPGWTVKAKIRSNGKLDKFYFNPSGESFNSKIGVCRHLGVDPKSTGVNQQQITPYVQSTVASSEIPEASTTKTPRKKISPNLKTVAECMPLEKSQENGEGDYSPGKVYFERAPADGLPTGWIKEIKIQNISGKIRRDPFYLSPSGERFNSKVGACRHLGLDPKTTSFSEQQISPYVQSNSSTVASLVTAKASNLKTRKKSMSPNLKPAAHSMPSEKNHEHGKDGEGDYSPRKVYFERVPADDFLQLPMPSPLRFCPPNHNEMPQTPSNLVDQEPEAWLPPGWTVKAKIRPNGRLDKFYFSASGECFNSKVGVCRHLGLDPKISGVSQQQITPYVQLSSSTVASSVNTEGSTLKTPRKTSSPKLTSAIQPKPSEKSQYHCTGGEGDYSPGKVYFERVPADGLPTGWIKEIKIRNIGGKIRRDPLYLSPSGERFNSKVGVNRHLGLDPKTTDVTEQPITPRVQSMSSVNTEGSTPKTPRKTISPRLKQASQPTSPGNSQEHGRGGEGDYSPGKVYFERVQADGLPKGWIKEIKIQKICGKTRKDPYFTDPVSGYVFRSLKDSLRFIETGEPGRLAFKPKTPVAAETVEVAGNFRKRKRSDDPAEKLNEITPDEKDSTIRKSSKKCQVGAHVSKPEKEQSVPRRSSGRLTASKEKNEVQNTEKRTTKNHANAEALSSKTASCRDPSKSVRNTDSADIASIFPNNTGNGSKSGYKSHLVMSYEESWLDSCIDFAVNTLTEAHPTGKDSVNDFNIHSQEDDDGPPPGFGSIHISRAKHGSGNVNWNKAEVPPVSVEYSAGSGSRPNFVKGTDRSLFR